MNEDGRAVRRTLFQVTQVGQIQCIVPIGKVDAGTRRIAVGVNRAPKTGEVNVDGLRTGNRGDEPAIGVGVNRLTSEWNFQSGQAQVDRILVGIQFVDIGSDGTADHQRWCGTGAINAHAQHRALGLAIHGRHAPLSIDVHHLVLTPYHLTRLNVNPRLVAAWDGSLAARHGPRPGQVPIQLVAFAARRRPSQLAHFGLAPFVKNDPCRGRFLLCRG